MSLSQQSCYFCAAPADGSPDHVPPEAIFRGFSDSYKSPKIITVPSCHEHNQGASADDEVLAWVMSDASSAGSSVGLDVFQALMRPASERVYKDRKFVDERLKRCGIRFLRDPKDFDENGRPKPPVYDAEYFRRAEQSLRDRWVILERSLQKIAAGLYFHATGNSLGISKSQSLKVVVPEFKQIGVDIALVGLACDETAFFSNTLVWRKIVSGSPKVFQCDIAYRSLSKQFSIKMLFFESIRVWIKPN
jgi:hypothetical protein